MIADKPQVTASLPKPARLPAADADRLLQNPDDLTEAFRGLDCAVAARLVAQLTEHLRTATQVDCVIVIDELAVVCAADRPGQSALRNLSRAVAKFFANCMQFVADDDTEFVIIEFVSTVPLVYGYDLLCKVGTAYGLVHGTPDSEFAGAVRYVDDINAIEHAIEIWRERARRVIASGYVMEEGHLFLFLDGLARLGVGATDADAMAALHEFCRDVPGGFAYFLKRAPAEALGHLDVRSQYNLDTNVIAPSPVITEQYSEEAGQTSLHDFSQDRWLHFVQAFRL